MLQLRPTFANYVTEVRLAHQGGQASSFGSSQQQQQLQSPTIYIHCSDDQIVTWNQLAQRASTSRWILIHSGWLAGWFKLDQSLSHWTCPRLPGRSDGMRPGSDAVVAVHAVAPYT
ncbi:hypothetical protein RRG08_055682 [Elysia crispata]|uniref:Uncharacterized protein n=1 Tax=Elysia crispata TaxID=231223 RepID=A0AAE0ZBM3_9GAST|nr:hypothetical protein RRG08_055682 [Elysia crispata]